MARKIINTKVLTKREKQVRDLVIRNVPNAKISQLLGISPRTVEDIISIVRKKYGVHNQIGLMRAAYQITDGEGVCDPDSSEIPTSRYRHLKTGGTYRFMHHAFIEHNLLPAVVYRSEKDNTVWVRPALEFFDKKRFELFEGGENGTDKRPSVFLQWKGTDACLDFYCECGAHCHFDGAFAYVLRCPHCSALWEMPCMLFPRKADDKTYHIDMAQDLEPDEDFLESKEDTR